MRHHSKTRRLAVESLENRSLLAGNVLASVDASGLLTVTGSPSDNRIIIRQLPASGSSTTWEGCRYSITGYASVLDSTTVNGQSSVIVEGVKNVNIAMNDGGDSVRIHNPDRPGSLANLPGIVNIDLGSNSHGNEGADLWIENHNQVNIHLGAGSDGLRMHARLHKLNVLGDSVFEPGDPPGHDDLELYFSAGGPVAIDTKYGNDEVRISNLPNAAVTTNAKATLTVNTGSGDDRVSVVLGGLTTNGLVRLGAALRIETGDGQDRVLVSDVEQATVVTVNTGRGNDNIWVQSSPVVFPKLSVWAGEGDDRLVLHGIKSTRTVLGGGDGTDTLETFQNYPSELGDATISGFEVFENNPV